MSIQFRLILSLLAALGGSVTKKYYTNLSPSGFLSSFIFNAVTSFTAAAVLLCWGGFGTASVFTIVLGALFGVLTAFQCITNLAALHIGPMSYTTVIISFSTLITALSGAIFFNESLSAVQLVGIAMMLASFVLAAKNDGEEKKANLRWLLLCLLAFASSGGIGIMQKVHQSSDFRGEINAFLIIAFISSALLCVCISLFLKCREKQLPAPSIQKTKDTRSAMAWILLGIMLVSGFCIAANNKFNLYLSGVMDSAVFFPIVNGGGLVLATLAALIIFKERLSKKQWIGVVLGIASVVFLCDPFS